MKRIGILLIHGVGEQRRFEHLETETRHLVRALERLADENRVTVTTRTTHDNAYLAEQVMWQADEHAPVELRFVQGGEQVSIEIREVWWADLDERNTLWSQVKFWAWGLAQWRVKVRKEELTDKLSTPTQPDLWVPRTQLFGLAYVFALVLVTLSLFNFVLSRLFKGKIPGPQIISSYVGDVKLIVQGEYEGTATLANFRATPRAAIRRRAVQGVVDMALADYDRWYIAAHSLGTVVAQNVLNETAACLPNYLSQPQYEKCLTHLVSGLDGTELGPIAGSQAGVDASAKKMRPPRPPWLLADQVVFRERLYARLRGVLTYGSPLDKFATLWPDIVGYNAQRPFQDTFEWINVYDETDTISGKLDLLCDTEPRNHSFSSGSVLLLSHVRYLVFGESGRLVERFADWVSSGSDFSALQDSASAHLWGGSDPRGARRWSAALQWVVLVLVLTPLAGLVVRLSLAMTPWMKLPEMQWDMATVIELYAFGALPALGAVLVAGLIHEMLRRAGMR